MTRGRAPPWTRLRAAQQAAVTRRRRWAVLAHRLGTDPLGRVTRCFFDAAGRLLSQTDPNERPDDSVHVRQTQPSHACQRAPPSKSTVTEVTDPRGYKRRVTFNRAGYTLEDRWVNQPEEQFGTNVRPNASNLVTSSTNPHGDVTDTEYDSLGARIH